MERFDAGGEKEMFQARFPEEKVPPCCHQSKGRMQKKRTGKMASATVVGTESG
jgi:hypothetical protein